MTERTRVILARVVASVAVTGALAGCAWVVVLGLPEALWQDYLVHNSIVAVGLGAMVWMVIPSQPRNRVVWISALAAVLTGVTPLLTGLMYQSMANMGLSGSVWEVGPADFPLWLAWVGTVSNSAWMGIMLVPTLVILHLPDGRLLSPRWKWLARLVWTLWWVGVIGFASASRPGTENTYGEIQQLALFSGSLVKTLSFFGFVGLGMTIPLCVSGVVVRFRRSTGVERQQLRWVVWGASIAAPLLVTGIVYETAGRVEVALVLLALSIVILIASFGVAIGKYRLYDVDVVINRTVVFAVLAGFIALMYATISLGLGTMIGQTGSDWAPILATASVAFAFEPVRHVAQRWANRIAYGHRATPYEVLADLTGRLDGAEPADGVLSRIAGLLAEGTGASAAVVWLGSPGSMSAVATTGDPTPTERTPDLDSDTVFPVTHDGLVVGALEVVKPRGMALSSSERALVEDMAGSASAVLGFQKLNESLAVKATEIEASRRRMVVAEDQERKRLEKELNEGAQQLILALKVNIDLARRGAVERGSDRLAGLLAGLVEETQAALDEVRDLAKGIYPPVLESDGLGPAVSALAASAPVEVLVSKDGVGRYPAEIEAAVYFDVSEAVTNAVKHALPPIRIDLSDDGGTLRFAVSDSGPGFDPETAAGGSGLENLHDRVDAVGGRLSILSTPGEGTVVAGEIPVTGRIRQPTQV